VQSKLEDNLAVSILVHAAMVLLVVALYFALKLAHRRLWRPSSRTPLRH
jgi:hypothetical protein